MLLIKLVDVSSFDGLRFLIQYIFQFSFFLFDNYMFPGTNHKHWTRILHSFCCPLSRFSVCFDSSPYHFILFLHILVCPFYHKIAAIFLGAYSFVKSSVSSLLLKSFPYTNSCVINYRRNKFEVAISF